MLLVALSACDAVGDPVAGAGVYADACENCHGASGDAGVRVEGVAAADLHDAVQRLDKAEFADAVVYGKGAMPGQPELAQQSAADVVAYCFDTFTAKP